jgi:hypothetical protein
VRASVAHRDAGHPVGDDAAYKRATGATGVDIEQSLLCKFGGAGTAVIPNGPGVTREEKEPFWIQRLIPLPRQIPLLECLDVLAERGWVALEDVLERMVLL